MQNQDKNLPPTARSTLSNTSRGEYLGASPTFHPSPVIDQISERDPSGPPTESLEFGVADQTTPTVMDTAAIAEDTAVPNEPQAAVHHKSTKAHLIVGAVMIAIVLALASFVAFTNRGRQVAREAAYLVSEQGVQLGGLASTQLSLEGLQSENEKLVVNGDLVARGSVVLASGNFFGSLQAPGLSANQTYNLPNASGTICLDSNNCGYLAAGGAVTSLGGAAGAVTVGEGLTIQNNTISATGGTPVIPPTTTIAGVGGTILLGSNLEMTGNVLSATIPSGLNTTVNGLSNAIIIQGTPDQVTVNTAGQNITLSGPQNLAVTSAPTFASLALTTVGTQGGNVICDISNNCGYLSAASAFLQNGNSFGVPAILGTNDGNALLLETANTTRVTITAGGNVGIGNTSPNYLLSVGAGDAFSVSGSGTVRLPNLSAADTDAVVCRNSNNELATCNNSFAPAAGSGSYIQNGTTIQTNANMAIQSLGDTDVTAVIRARGTQSADLLQLQNSGGGAMSGFSANGRLYFTNSGFSGSLGSVTLTGNRVINLPDANGTVCLDSGNCIGAGGAAPADALYLTLSADPQLTNARVLTAGSNLNFTDGGAGNPLTVATVDNPTFSTSVTTPILQSAGAMSITPGAALTVGATGQSFTLQGSSASTITATNGVNTTTLAFTTPTANVTLNLPALPAGTYNICTTQGNCSGSGGGVTTTGGTTDRLAKFTGSQTIGDSIISESGGVITVLGDGVIQGGALALGEAQTAGGALTLYNATNTNTLTLQSGATGSNLTFTLPTADGAANQCIKTDGNGVFSFGDCLAGSGPGGGVTSLNSLSGTLNILGTTNQVGVVSGGSDITLSTPQDIATSSSPTFAGLTATGASGVTIGTANSVTGQVVLQNASNANTITLLSAVTTANRSITLPDASGTVAVSASGNIALSAAGNITFTGTLAVASGGTDANNASDARSNLGAAASGANSDITSTSALNTITPSGALTIGATGQGFTLQGTSASVMTGSNGGNTTTLGFTTPTANNSILLPDEAGTICLQNSTDCGFLTDATLADVAFVQDGNSFGVPAVLGTNDNESLSFETGGAAQATIAVGGGTTFRNSSDSSAAFQVQNAAGDNLLNVDSLNTRLTIGYPESLDSFTKIADPLELPTDGRSAAFSPDGQYMTVTQFNSPRIIIYKKQGNTFVKLPDPIGGLPTGSGNGTAWSPDGQYMSVAHNTSPYITIYKRSGDTFTKLPNPATLPASTGNGTAWSPDGQYMSVAHNTRPYITIYKRSGDTFTKLPNPATLPASTGNGTAWSPDGQYMSVAHNNSPYITIYKRDGDTFTKLANPAQLPGGIGNGTAWSPDGQYMSIAHFTTPYITIYKRSGDTFTKLPDPGTLPPDSSYSAAWSPDGQYMSVSNQSTSPYITIYKRSGDTFTKLANPDDLPTGSGHGTAFSPDGQYMSVAHATTPFITIYQQGTLTAVNGALQVNNSIASTGDGVFGGGLSVATTSYFNAGVTVGGEMTTYGDVLHQSATNSTTAFQIQNASGTALVNVASTNNNLVTNPSFESNANGWVAKGAATVSNTNAQAQFGTGSLAITTTAVANDGGTGYYSFQSSTTYTLSLWLRATTGASSSINIGYQENGSDIDCLTGQNLQTSTWQQYTCTFTTGATINTTSNIYIKQTNTTVRTIYVDGVTLVTGSNPQPYNQPGSLLQADATNNALTLLNNTSGELSSWQTNSDVLPDNRLGASSVTANGYVYVIGGSSDGTNGTNTVYYTKLNADGSVGAWQTNPNNLPAIRWAHSSVVANGYVYVIGGAASSTSGTSTVYYAKLNADGTTGVWQTSANTLPANRRGHTSVVANGYVYAIGGGTTATGSSVTVYYAKLNVDGSVGVWQTNANTLPTARHSHTSVIANGYVYVIGGTTGTSGITTVHYAQLNPDGSTGVWQSTTSIPAGRRNQTSVVANGYVYVLAGDPNTTTATSTIYYARLNSNGSIGAWSTNSNTLPANRANQTSIIANGYVYALGGGATDWDSDATNTVYYASTSRLQVGAANLDLVGLQGQNLADGGDFSQGSTGGSLTAGNGTFVGSLQVQGQASFASSAVIGDSLNVGGGAYVQNGATIESTAADTKGLVIKGATSQTANLQEWQNSTGTVMGSVSASGQTLFKNDADSTTAFQIQNSAGHNLLQVDTSGNQVTVLGNVADTTAWQTAAETLPANRASASSVTANGYVYVVGGYSGSTSTNTVYYAELNPDGSTGVWQTNANTLPGNRYFASSVTANGYIYVIGGWSTSSANTVYYAELNPDGSTGVWQTNSNVLPASSNGHTSVVANGYVYVIGGDTGGSQVSSSNTVYYAELNPDGSTGVWQTNDNVLPANRRSASSVVANGYVYVIAGSSTSGNQSAAVYYAELNPDGSTGVWQTNTNPLPVTRATQASVVANGYVYVIAGSESGGQNGTGSNTVYYAELNPDGSTGVWQIGNNLLPANRLRLTSVIANGYVYAIGGSTSGSSAAVDTVYYANLNLSARSLNVGGNLNLMNLYSQATAEEFGTAPVGGSVIALNGDFAGTLTAGGATTLQGGATIQTGADDAIGLIVQGASGQTANLQEWQDDGGNVLAFVSAAGDLSVVNAAVTGTLTVTGTATFNDTITVNGHIITGNTSGVTTIGAEAGAGSGASVNITGNDTAGTVTITTGTGAGIGTLATVTFANAYGANARVVLTPANSNGASIQYFIGTAGTTTFTIDSNDAPTDATEYIYNYHVLQ